MYRRFRCPGGHWHRGVQPRAGAPAYFFFVGLTADFRVAPAENFGVFDAAILIASPVAGLRPLRAARFATEKVPKPVMPTVSPFFRRSVMMAISVFTAPLAAAADTSVRFANSAINSPFFITTSLVIRARRLA